MKESNIYPGEYVPLPETELLLRRSELSLSQQQGKPLVNMNETRDAIAIEVILPGANRDHISVYTQYNILTIMVLGNMERKHTVIQEQIHEFDKGCLERHIVLPENADTDFMSAEFKQGVLRLNITKNGQGLPVTSRQVIVY